MGVGVPLGVLLVSFLIYEHRLRIKAEKTIIETVAAHNRKHSEWMREERQHWMDHPGPLELETTQTQPGELFDGEVHEVGGTR